MSLSYIIKKPVRSIVHVDGDAFFASCEIAQNEALRGKPVVTGEDRGIATAVSYAAKALGVSRGMTIRDIRKIFPAVIVTSSSYDVYRMYSERMYRIVKRYAPIVEEYSVDECFADITGLERHRGMSYDEIAQKIKSDLEHDLGMTFSVGLAPTKVLAKVASKHNKPSGFTSIPYAKIPEFLEHIPVGKIWGIGPNTSAHLMNIGVRTALELAIKPEWWIRENLSKPYLEIWHELNGIQTLKVHADTGHEYKSIMKTGTFHPATNNSKVLLSELAKNVEKACTKLRANRLTTKEVHFFIKTQQFSYHHGEFKLPLPSAIPADIINILEKEFFKVFNKNRIYRATGIIMRGLVPEEIIQHDLFGASVAVQEKSVLYHTVDEITDLYGKNSLFLAQSFKSRHYEHWDNHRTMDQTPAAKLDADAYDMSHKLGIPYWGKAA